MNRYKKLNTDWNSKLYNVLQNKEENFENKLNEKIERIEKKHFKETNINTEPNTTKNRKNLTYKLEKISVKMGLKSEKEEKERLQLEKNILKKMRSISKNKDENINENNKLLIEKNQEKFKMNQDANNYLENLKDQKIQEKEKQNIEKLRLFKLKKDELKKSLEYSKEKQNKKINEIKYNIELLEKIKEQKIEKLFEKHTTIELRPKDALAKRIHEFMNKRQRSLEKYKQNSDQIQSKIEQDNDKIYKNFQIKVIKAENKAKSYDLSKQNIKANTIISHLGLRNKIENIYEKLKRIGEKSLFNKPAEDRFKDLIKIREKKEFEEKLRLELKKKELEEAKDYLWSQQQKSNIIPETQATQNTGDNIVTYMKGSFFTTDLVKK